MIYKWLILSWIQCLYHLRQNGGSTIVFSIKKNNITYDDTTLQIIFAIFHTVNQISFLLMFGILGLLHHTSYLLFLLLQRSILLGRNVAKICTTRKYETMAGTTCRIKRPRCIADLKVSYSPFRVSN